MNLIHKNTRFFSVKFNLDEPRMAFDLPCVIQDILTHVEFQFGVSRVASAPQVCIFLSPVCNHRAGSSLPTLAACYIQAAKMGPLWSWSRLTAHLRHSEASLLPVQRNDADKRLPSSRPARLQTPDCPPSLCCTSLYSVLRRSCRLSL